MNEITSTSRMQADGTWKLTVIDEAGRSAVTVLDQQPTEQDVIALADRLASRVAAAAVAPEAAAPDADAEDASASQWDDNEGGHEPVDPDVRLEGDVE